MTKKDEPAEPRDEGPDEAADDHEGDAPEDRRKGKDRRTGKDRRKEPPETAEHPTPDVHHRPEPDADNLIPAEDEPGTF